MKQPTHVARRPKPASRGIAKASHASEGPPPIVRQVESRNPHTQSHTLSDEIAKMLVPATGPSQ